MTRYSYMSSDRLNHEQYERLVSILECLAVPAPEFGWDGLKQESRHLSSSEWKHKISTELYHIYRDLHPADIDFNMDHIEDFFDDAYVDELTSIKGWFRRMLTCCTVWVRSV
jgi:hypothetical protein